MRSLLSLALAFGLVVGLAACDTAESSTATADAKKSNDGFIVRTVDANGNASEHRQDKVAVCHYDDETDSYKRLSVGAPALPAHVRHGDGVPGSVVEGAPVFSVFDEGCEVVEVPRFSCTVERSGVPGSRIISVTATALDPALDPLQSGTSTITFPDGEVPLFAKLTSTSALFAGTFVNSEDEALTGIFVSVSAVGADGTLLTCGPEPVVLPDPS